jgi:predicted dehydrogenase
VLRLRNGTMQRREGFQFENYEVDGEGPESLQAFIDACNGGSPFVGADADVGLHTVRAIDAMYRSSLSGALEATL